MLLHTRRYFLAILATFSLAGAAQLAHAANQPQVLLKTSMGDIVVELNAEKAPKTVENFLQYVKKGHYNGTIFHRVIDGFMIQGGGFDKDMKQKPAPTTVENEAKNGLKNETYTLAMARTSDPQSASAQFFINVGANAALDYPGSDGWGYAVFGKVIKGTDVVDKIRLVPTGNSGGHQNVPTKAVTIESATLIK
jgi:peptidyl-prolyl cis-trans isomerase A (cyclophilin A)/peptidyl-prolyl cis-trans isomerase B (cyclophilin B)